MGTWEGKEPQEWLPGSCSVLLKKHLVQAPIFQKAFADFPQDDDKPPIQDLVLEFLGNDLAGAASAFGAARIVWTDECTHKEDGSTFHYIIKSIAAQESGGTGGIKYSSAILPGKFLVTMNGPGMDMRNRFERDYSMQYRYIFSSEEVAKYGQVKPVYRLNDAIQFLCDMYLKNSTNVVMLGMFDHEKGHELGYQALWHVMGPKCGLKWCCHAVPQVPVKNLTAGDLERWKDYVPSITAHGEAILGSIDYNHDRLPWKQNTTLVSCSSRSDVMMYDKTMNMRGSPVLCRVEGNKSFSVVAKLAQISNLPEVVDRLCDAPHHAAAAGQSAEMDVVNNKILNVDASLQPVEKIRKVYDNLRKYFAENYGHRGSSDYLDEDWRFVSGGNITACETFRFYFDTFHQLLRYDGCHNPLLDQGEEDEIVQRVHEWQQEAQAERQGPSRAEHRDRRRRAEPGRRGGRN
ncbi:MAG: hypothetical protein SGARI_000839 [Bacillariaceae sp.]